MIKIPVKTVVRSYPPVFFSLFAVIIFGRMTEITLIGFFHGWHLLNGPLLMSMTIYDLEFIFFASIPLWLLLAGFRLVAPRAYRYAGAGVFALLGLVHILLIFYFGDTLVPLGPEFWAYSPVEMVDTVVAAGKLNAISLLSLSAALAVLFLGIKKILSVFEERQVNASLSGWLLLSGIVLVTASQALGASDFNSDRDLSANKSAYFLQSSVESYSWKETNQADLNMSAEYPFLHSAAAGDVLGPFFKEFNTKPNIVFLIVESFGGEFTGKNGQWAGFTPFIDSLAGEGLYWENGLSMSGRTFGMMPSIFGSLPPGRNGFMSEGPLYPDHLTLISLLKQQGYHTSFYSGFDTYFDGLDLFLEYQEIDFKLNKEAIHQMLNSPDGDSGQNYWGYDDKTMLSLAAEATDRLSAFPRLEIYHTLQSHSPFSVPQNDLYIKKFEEQLNRLNTTDAKKESFRRYRDELTTLMYTDNAVREFFRSYRQRDHYKDTIFIITGDHWLIPVPQTTQISRYHVPIIIYSPLIREPTIFQSTNTHANIAPTLVSLLANKAGLSQPEKVHWIAGQMDTTRTFRNIHSLAMMKTKNQLNDYLDMEYYLSDGILFKIGDNLSLDPVDDTDRKSVLANKLNQFKIKNDYAIQQNKLYPGSKNLALSEEYRFLADYDTLFSRLDSLEISPDQQFKLAREYAFNREYELARVISKRILMQSPGYHDVRILMARTHAWNGEYDRSRELLKETMRRDSTYYDAYNALFDTEYWAGNYQTALEVIENGLALHPDYEEFVLKKEKVEDVLK